MRAWACVKLSTFYASKLNPSDEWAALLLFCAWCNEYGNWVQTILTVVGFVFFVLWLKRIVTNEAALSGDALKVKPSAAILGSLVPVVNLVYPFVIIGKVWHASSSRTKHRSTVLVSLWATFWTITTYYHWTWMTAANIYEEKNSVDGQQLMYIYSVDLVSQLSFLVAGFVGLVVVSKLNRVQSRKALAKQITTVPLKMDLVTFSGAAIGLLAQVAWPFIGLAGVIMIYSFVWNQFGLIGSIGAVLFVPFTVTLIPWYAAFAKQDWSLVFISYAAGLLLILMRVVGNWLSDLSDEPVAMVTNIDANQNSDQKAALE